MSLKGLSVLAISHKPVTKVRLSFSGASSLVNLVYNSFFIASISSPVISYMYPANSSLVFKAF